MRSKPSAPAAAHGSIVGRNSFQRPRQEALSMLDRVIRIYLGEEAGD